MRRAARFFVLVMATVGCVATVAAVAPAAQAYGHNGTLNMLCVPKTSSTSCDQAIFVDQATDASLPSDVVLLKAGWFG